MTDQFIDDSWLCQLVSRVRIHLAALLCVAGNCAGQEIKLLPNENSDEAYFGRSVLIGENLIVVGAFQDLGTYTGDSYLFDRHNGALIRKLEPAGEDMTHGFGGKSAIDQGVIAIGSVMADTNGNNSGAAYLFDAATGVQIAKLLPDDGAQGDWFGASLAMGDGIVAVGAIYDDDNGSQSGSVYLFDATSGAQLAKLLPTDGGPGDTFGESLAIDDGILAVSAQLDSDNGSRSGSAYLFDLSNGAQLHKLLSSDGQAEDRFGFWLDMQGGLVVVGAYRDDDMGSNSGSAYIFDAETGDQISKLVPSDGAAEDSFGFTVAIHDGLVAVGAKGDDDHGADSGSVYLFSAQTGMQITKLTADDAAMGDQFGRTVSMGSGGLVVGAWWDDDRGLDSGSAYVFDTSCPADLNNDFALDSGDITIFIDRFLGHDPFVDMNHDGVLDMADVGAFIGDFISGCF